MRNDSAVRVITVTILGILGLWFIYTLIFGSGMGQGFGFSGNYGGEHMNMGYGLGMGYGSTFAYILLLLIKVLFAVFVIALVAGIVVWIKNNMFTREDIDTIKNTFKGNNTTIQKEKCADCDRIMEAEWKLCPHCGKEKEI